MADLLLFGPSLLAKQFRLTVAQRGVFTANASSTAIDTQLYLLTGDRRSILASNDDSDGGTNSKVVAYLPPGDYTLVVASKRSGVTGAFDLKNVSEAQRTCTIQDLTPGTDVQGSFSASSCRGLDLATTAVSSDTQLQNRYRIRLDKVAVINAQTESAQQLRLSLLPETGTGNTVSATNQLLASQPAGSQILRVVAPDVGSFTLKTTREDPRPCTPKTLEPGAQIDNSFQSSSCRWLDVFVPSATTAYVERYRINVSARQVFTFDQKSPDMDSLLILYDSRNTRIGFEDDIDDDNLDSRMVIQLTPGAYTLLATQTRTKTGGFQLAASAEDPRPCNAAEMKLGAPIEGTMADTGCRVADVLLFDTDTSIVTPFKVTLDKRQMLKLDANIGGDVGGDMLILTPEARLVNFDSTDFDNNAALDLLLGAGTYLVALVSPDDPRPTYVLRGATRDQPACPSADIGLPGSASGTLSSSDCKLGEMTLETGIGAAARQFQTTVTTPGRISLSLNSTDFPGVLVVATANDQILGIGARSSPGRITLSGPVSAGGYKFFVSSVGGTGSFTLDATLDTGGPAADVTSMRLVPEGTDSGVTSWPELSALRMYRRAAATKKKLPLDDTVK
ncbi:MAG: hypothetical protein U0Q16_13705 [Bryobacteraceae bacterium]